jgi:hypothetical protein
LLPDFNLKIKKITIRKTFFIEILLIILIIFAVSRSPKAKDFFLKSIKVNFARIEVVKKTDIIKSHISADKKVYIIWQGSDGHEVVITRYELFPRHGNFWFWSFGKPYPRWDEDFWTYNLSLKEFLEKIDGYDYLFVGHGDKQFWDKYYLLFREGKNARDAMIFKINKKAGKISLERII